MKRKVNKKADFILTADWHVQEKNPICRKDDFVNSTQWDKIAFISNLQKKHNCTILHSGDFYDYWKPSPELLAKTLMHIPEKFWSVYGNHDLPQHNLELIHKCGLYVLNQAKKVEIINGGHWGSPPVKPAWQGEVSKGVKRKIAVWHTMTYQGKKPYPGCTDKPARSLLRRYQDFDLIVTGDNHVPFVEQEDGRLLVNPGSIFRTSASQIEHKPRVYLYYLDDNTVEPIYLPIEKNVISREHIEIKEERDNRIKAFVDTINDDWVAEMSFTENLKKFFQINKTKDPIINIIHKAIENETNKTSS